MFMETYSIDLKELNLPVLLDEGSALRAPSIVLHEGIESSEDPDLR
jgi:hypothetical protein